MGRSHSAQGWSVASPPGLKQPHPLPWGPHTHPSLQRTIGQILAATEAFSRFETILEVSSGEGP